MLPELLLSQLLSPRDSIHERQGSCLLSNGVLLRSRALQLDFIIAFLTDGVLRSKQSLSVDWTDASNSWEAEDALD